MTITNGPVIGERVEGWQIRGFTSNLPTLWVFFIELPLVCFPQIQNSHFLWRNSDRHNVFWATIQASRLSRLERRGYHEEAKSG